MNRANSAGVKDRLPELCRIAATVLVRLKSSHSVQCGNRAELVILDCNVSIVAA
jgi:hypothetical protein